uniref:Uncharacterized protein n=1 Tax=Plectus sambesii TaxID=2011161 RepID=A0A914W887_9BILA
MFDDWFDVWPQSTRGYWSQQGCSPPQKKIIFLSWTHSRPPARFTSLPSTLLLQDSGSSAVHDARTAVDSQTLASAGLDAGAGRSMSVGKCYLAGRAFAAAAVTHESAHALAHDSPPEPKAEAVPAVRSVVWRRAPAAITKLNRTVVCTSCVRVLFAIR